MERFHLVFSLEYNLRVHRWLRSDEQGAFHDHPWDNTTVVLAGELVESTPDGDTPLIPGDVVSRQARWGHRVELVSDEAWTLFSTGPIHRDWGFHTRSGWVNWRKWPASTRTVALEGHALPAGSQAARPDVQAARRRSPSARRR